MILENVLWPNYVPTLGNCRVVVPTGLRVEIAFDAGSAWIARWPHTASIVRNELLAQAGGERQLAAGLGGL